MDRATTKVAVEEMPVQLFDYPGIFKASFDEKTGIITHEWINYNPEGADSTVIRILDEIYNSFLKTGSSKVLVITSHARGAFSPTVQNYITNIQFPRCVSDTNVRFVATVLPANKINVIYTTLWTLQVARSDRFIKADFSSADEALDWLLARSEADTAKTTD